ncbi:MAG: hypothetical protein JWN92_1073, partial [Candidatus Acidoferrum typicum]|nr:hypothetical protein [Candidatus Acidoferrum typicum]
QPTLTASFTVDGPPDRLHIFAGNISPTLPVCTDVRQLLPTNVVTGLIHIAYIQLKEKIR